MPKKPAKRRRVSIPTVTVRWPKGSEGKARFDEAVKIAGGNGNKTARGLLDEWANVVLSGASTIEQAVERYEKKRAGGKK